MADKVKDPYVIDVEGFKKLEKLDQKVEYTHYFGDLLVNLMFDTLVASGIVLLVSVVMWAIVLVWHGVFSLIA